jgi:hypothetical protein
VQHLQQVGSAELRRSTSRGDLLCQPEQLDSFTTGNLGHGRRVRLSPEMAALCRRQDYRATAANTSGTEKVTTPLRRMSVT